MGLQDAEVAAGGRDADSTRDRIASPSEAAELLTALEHDRALWATGFYAGLRRGELRGLEWDDVALGAGLIHVRRGWDDREGSIAPKSKAGRRDVPIVAALRAVLMEHRLRSGRAEGFVFGRSASEPFVPWTVDSHARKAWRAENVTRARENRADHAARVLGTRSRASLSPPA